MKFRSFERIFFRLSGAKKSDLAILLRSLKIFTNREGVRIDFLFFSIISIYINIYIFIYRIEREREKKREKEKTF